MYLPYLNDTKFLQSLAESRLQEIYVRITVLDFKENPLMEIQGKVTGGSLSVRGDSSVRRTGDLTFIPDAREEDISNFENIISVNKKIKLEVGYKNYMDKYLEFDILWIPLGTYVMFNASLSKSLDNISVSFSIQDKMCLLNGSLGSGLFHSAVTLDTYTYFEKCTITSIKDNKFTGTVNEMGIEYWKDGDIISFQDLDSDFPEELNEIKKYYLKNVSISNGTTISFEISNAVGGTSLPVANFTGASGFLAVKEIETKATIYTIIKKIVEHYGGEQQGNIIVDVPERAKQIIRWNGSEPIYLIAPTSGNEYSLSDTTSGTNPREYSPGQNLGYEFVDFTYPEELVADAGQSVCEILDKIRDTLGNWEYFYDIDGNFIFREIRNFINNGPANYELDTLTKDSYITNGQNQEATIFDFSNSQLLTSFNYTPSYENIKNDFLVWGKRKSLDGKEYPIRYHLAIDNKPQLSSVLDWRTQLFLQGEKEVVAGVDINPYYTELKNEWPKIYDVDLNQFKDEALKDPSSIDYFLDLIDTDSTLNELNIANIGKRSHVVKDDKVNCILPPKENLDIAIIRNINSQLSVDAINILKREAEINGYNKILIITTEALDNSLSLGIPWKDAFSVVRQLLVEHTKMQGAVSLSTIPIYHLQENTLVSVPEIEGYSGGDLIINSFTLPLNIDEQMNITASSVVRKI